MLWIKAFHIIFMVTWFAGLFYLPRLFVYHTLANDMISIDRFKIMERKLFFGIMTPGAIFTVILGIWMLVLNPGYLHFGWMHAKLSLVILLLGYHVYLGKLLRDFKQNRNRHGHVFYRIINEGPVLFLVAIVLLVIVR